MATATTRALAGGGRRRPVKRQRIAKGSLEILRAEDDKPGHNNVGDAVVGVLAVERSAKCKLAGKGARFAAGQEELDGLLASPGPASNANDERLVAVVIERG